MQASKQMLETGDFVDIRFQDEPRYKKPVLIYWMQAASVTVFAGGDTSALWAYRLPSTLGAILAVLFTYWTASLLVGRSGAIVAAVLLAASVLLTAEAHIAKTDALLLAAIMGGQYALAALYCGQQGRKPFLIFWIALGIGFLIKGPVAWLPALATLAGLGLWDRGLAWARPLRPLLGIPLVALVVLPWFVAIILQSDGLFIERALFGDMLSKVSSGQESHGAPPGYYLAIIALTFWPGSLFLVPAIAGAWTSRGENAVRFLLCWIVPVWLIFELVPTKLPHYTLPVFPALAILCALAVTRAEALVAEGSAGAHLARGWTRYWVAFWTLLGLILAVAFLAVPSILKPGTFQLPSPLLWSVSLCAVAAALFAAAAYRRGAFRDAVTAAVFGAAGMYLLIFEAAIPAQKTLWVATRLTGVVADSGHDTSRPVLIAGFREPSAVFLLGTETRHGNGDDAARYLAAAPDRLVLVEARQRAAFLAEAAVLGLKPEAGETVRGLNYSRGDPVAVTLYRAGGN